MRTGEGSRTDRSGRASCPIAAMVTIALIASACSGTAPDEEPSGATPVASATTAPRQIAQPRVPEDLPVAPTDERVDVAMPSFSDPTAITNSLLPVSHQ